LIPPPLDTGTLDLLTVDKGPAVDPSSPTAVLGVPDDWAWVVTYGALSCLLGRDGLAFDPMRAAYCDQRWTQGIALCAAASVVLTARVENQTRLITSFNDLDRYSRSWQTQRAQPRMPALMGHNMLGLSPVPNTPSASPSYAITLDVVRNAPIPRALNQVVQIAPAYIDSVLDYAQHLALFKEGGAQLGAAMPLLESMFSEAGVSSQIDQGNVSDRAAMLGQTSQESAINPRGLPPPQTTGAGVVVTNG